MLDLQRNIEFQNDSKMKFALCDGIEKFQSELTWLYKFIGYLRSNKSEALPLNKAENGGRMGGFRVCKVFDLAI